MTALAHRLVALMLVLPLTACAARAPHGLHVWELRGAVWSVQGHAVDVWHKSGRLVKLTVDELTAYVRDGSPASLESLEPGRRVSVEVESINGVRRARRVRVFGNERR